MGYVVRAVRTDGGAGTFTAELETRRDAITSANELRRQGMQVTITDADGNPVGETEEHG
jgi:hypothetical protein